MDTGINDASNDALQTKCKACGGFMQYSPQDQNLKCIYCGSISELEKTPVEIKENSYEKWESIAAEADGDNYVQTTEIRCRQCGATTTMPANTSGVKCLFCGTPLILNEASVKRFWQPNYLIPFKISDKVSRDNFGKWIGKKWFAPSNIKKGGLDMDNFKGIYLPYWTYDAHTQTSYIGERGVHRTEEYTNEKGEKQRRTVTDWYPASGVVTVDFDDIMVPAGGKNRLPDGILNSLNRWNMVECVPYRKEFLAGFTTEIYERDFRDCLADAKVQMEPGINSEVRNDIGGNEQRIHTMDVEYRDIMFKLLLLPIWVSAFRYKGRPYQFVVNGSTGEVLGQYPRSTSKIILVVVLIILALYLLFRFLA